MKILFMCLANSARSQLAEGLARHLFDKKVWIESAGSTSTRVNPIAIQAMKEIGIDITEHYSKTPELLAREFLANLDYVITLCAEEVCPIFLSRAKKLHWPHPDPGASLQSFRETR